ESPRENRFRLTGSFRNGHIDRRIERYETLDSRPETVPATARTRSDALRDFGRHLTIKRQSLRGSALESGLRPPQRESVPSLARWQSLISASGHLPPRTGAAPA